MTMTDTRQPSDFENTPAGFNVHLELGPDGGLYTVPNAKRGAARPDMPFVVCGGCGKRLRSTADGYPRAHECGLPAATNARYVAELWGTTDEESGDPALRLWSAQYFEAWRAKARATTRMRATAGAPVRWVKVIEVRDTPRGVERTGRVWVRDPYTEWQEMPAQTCKDA